VPPAAPDENKLAHAPVVIILAIDH
jgi:hypothetical protein